MRCTPSDSSSSDVPEIIQAVLIQATRLRSQGAISSRYFNQQIKRLVCEELLPRGLSVSIEDTVPGHARFVLKEKNGTIRQTIDC